MELDALWRPFDIIGCNLIGKRFIGAQSVEGVLALGSRLINQGYKLTYNLLGEHAIDIKATEMALKTTLDLIRGMDSSNYGNVSCKPTLYGLMFSKTAFQDILCQIVEAAYKCGIEVEIDAENYDYLEDTFDVFSAFASNSFYRNTVRQAVQAHVRNIERLMDKHKLWDKNLRVVKGAGVYEEKDSVVTQNGFLIMERYMEILRRNIRNGRVPFAATVRDDNLAEEVIKFTADGRFPFEFQMLFGPLGEKLRRDLLSRGYSVREYVPFTDEWCRDAWKPYGLRRAQMIRRMIWDELLRL